MAPGRSEERPCRSMVGLGAGVSAKGSFQPGSAMLDPLPVHLRIAFLPQEPDFAGVVGEQVFAREAEVNGKFFGALGDEHDVAGVFEDLASDQTDVLDIAHAADGACATR